MDVRRAAFRLTEIFDYRTFAVAGAFGTLCIVGFLVYSSAQTAHDALRSQQQTRLIASRRIDGLQRVIAEQAQHIADNSTQQAAMRQQIAVLARQVQLMGGRPIVAPQPAPSRTYVVAAPPASSKPKPRQSSRPQASPSRPASPSPTPQPTCRPLPLIGCR